MVRKLKVAHVVYSLEIGGLEKVVADMVSHFDREKICPLVYCIGAKGVYADRLEDEGIGVFKVNNDYLPHSVFSMAGSFRKEKIDIVHSHSGVYRDAVMAGLIAGVPVIIHTDHGRFYPDKGWTRLNHRFFSGFRDKVIAVSDELKKFMATEVKIDPSKIIRIYNGVDMSDHKAIIDTAAKKKELGIPLDDKIIGIVARLAPVKDHMTLLKAFKEVKEAFKKTKLLVIGDGPLKDILINKAIELKITDNVIFLGARKDVDELFHIMDLICLSSLSEGLSMTLIEAMASGKPVVATRVGGNPELVIDNVTGFLVPPRDPGKMAEVILNLLKNEGLREDMGQKGRERARTEFNMNKMVKNYEDLYFELARKRGAEC